MSGLVNEMCRILTAQSFSRKSFSAIVGRRYSTKFGDVVGCWDVLGLVSLTVVNGTARRDVVSGIKLSHFS
jgi:hypothetical protein